MTDPTTLISLLESYFQHFGGKACCFEDLQPYIELEGDELATWTSVLEKQMAASVSILSPTENSCLMFWSDLSTGPMALHQCAEAASVQPH